MVNQNHGVHDLSRTVKMETGLGEKVPAPVSDRNSFNLETLATLNSCSRSQQSKAVTVYLKTASIASKVGNVRGARRGTTAEQDVFEVRGLWVPSKEGTELMGICTSFSSADMRSPELVRACEACWVRSRQWGYGFVPPPQIPTSSSDLLSLLEILVP